MADVENHQVDGLTLGTFEGTRSRVHDRDRVTQIRQVKTDQVGDLDFVLGDEDVMFCHDAPFTRFGLSSCLR